MEPSAGEFFGSFKSGPGVNIDDPMLIAKATGRELARVMAAGKVSIDM